MIPWSLERVAEAVGGRVVNDPDQAVVTSVVSDSRDVRPGSLFVAIPGERVDGHDFVSQTLQQGAMATLSSRDVPGPAVMVDDSVEALGRLARAYRDSLTNITVVALTGSSGKTTTKDLLSVVLATAGETVSPKGSYNSEVGLPLTILECEESTRFLILEMGMRGFGHIDYLCGIGRPDIAGLINVGSAHLGMVGSREGIARAKGEIFDALPASGRAIANADDALVMSQADRSTAPVLTFGESAGSDVRFSDVRIDGEARPSFDIHYREDSAHVDLRIAGEHQAANATAAAAMAIAAGLPLPDIAQALSSAQALSKWRMEVHHRPDGVTIINDAYNANPESMRAALKALVAMGRDRRTWAVLGAMGELGEDAVEEHDSLGRMVVRLDVNKLLAVGDATRPLFLAASLEGSWGEEAAWVPDTEAAIALLNQQLEPGDVVLIKASRAVGLERISDALLGEVSG